MGHYDERPTPNEIAFEERLRREEEDARVRAALILIGRTNIVERLDSLDGTIDSLQKRIAKLETDLEHRPFDERFIGSL